MRRVVSLLLAVLLTAAGCASHSEPNVATTTLPPTTDTSAPASTTSAPVTTTVAAPTPTAAAATGVSAIDLCVGAVHSVGPQVTDERITEVSGIVVSRTEPDRLYAHNDSGDGAKLYAIGADGSIVDTIRVDAIAADWEDIAATDGTLFVGDIGDNLGIRPTLRVVAVDETTTIATSYTISYPAGRPDAEALIVDPTGTIVTIITKDVLGGTQRVYDATLDPGADVVVLTEVGVFPVEGVVTAADLSADGRVIAVRTSVTILLFDRAHDESVADALLRAPCEAPSAPEIQGEAIALHLDGRGYTTISEGSAPTRNDFRLP